MIDILRPRSIPFVKASACGNDFLLIDGKQAPSDIEDFTRRLCERHSGVGADGIEWLYPSPDAEIEARLINADGSHAEISGNGTRCVAANYVAERGGELVRVRTGAGMKVCNLVRREGAEFEFETAMGEPQVAGQLSLRLGSGDVTGTSVSMGNPHFVLFVEEFGVTWQAEALEIQLHPAFREGVNVEMVLVRDQHNIEVRFFERGVGETQSSGTGSCASAAAAIATGRARSPVNVQATGGTQMVRWDREVFLTGTARLVCRGDFLI